VVSFTYFGSISSKRGFWVSPFFAALENKKK
jgi:hypothetical protein